MQSKELDGTVHGLAMTVMVVLLLVNSGLMLALPVMMSMRKTD